MQKKTKIIATLGPASDECGILKKMIRAGLNVARLNFSHGSYEHMEKILKNLKKACRETGKTVAILQDLQGPKIRLGKLPDDGVTLKQGHRLALTTKAKGFREKPILTLPIQYKNLPHEVKPGDRILMNDGYFEMRVDHVKGNRIFGRAMNTGFLKSHKGINCPTASLSANALSAKDKKDLLFGFTQGVIDWVALSFVKSAQDIKTVRAFGKSHGHVLKVLAKIERHEAIEHLEEIAQEADGLMVARGDLGIEIPAEQVPIVQKEIVRLGLLHAKPVIIATQILESMVTEPRPTRAEISDAATAIFDHADAFMLSAETSVGKYPLQAVQTLARVAKRTEQELDKKDILLKNHLNEQDMPLMDATCFTAAEFAQHIDAAGIVVLTRSGYTARQIMKHRPPIPVVTLTYDESVKRELQLVWGLNTILVMKHAIDSAAQAIKEIPRHLKSMKLSKTSQEWVIVNATVRRKRHNFITTVVV